MILLFFFFSLSGCHRDLHVLTHSFPPRRSSDLVVRFKAYDLLVATNRGTDGRGYEQLRSAFKRLQGTQIETNILTGGTEALDIFSLIDRVRIMRETREGRMQEVEVRLSDWVFNAIRSNEVLTLRSEEHTSELQSLMSRWYAV